MEEMEQISVSHVVPKFRTKVREWNPWVENIQKLGFEIALIQQGEQGRQS